MDLSIKATSQNKISELIYQTLTIKVLASRTSFDERERRNWKDERSRFETTGKILSRNLKIDFLLTKVSLNQR